MSNNMLEAWNQVIEELIEKRNEETDENKIRVYSYLINVIGPDEIDFHNENS